MNILIFAGGSGTRLWPVSRKSSPKQLLKLVGDKTLLENTYDRCRTWVDKDRIFIATLAEYKTSVKKQLPQIPDSHYSLEPSLRDRGPAIGLAALIMNHHDPKSSFMTMWSDHSIQEPKGYFKNLLKQADKYLSQNPEATLTIGINPTYPHTGFGYIQKGKTKKNNLGLPISEVKSFKEKPNLKLATKFYKSKQYLWNSGYFIWKTENLLNLYKIHLPEVYEILMKIKPYLGTKNQQRAINKWYPKMPKVEVENGLIEKLKGNIITIEADIAWHDIGSWKVIKDIQSNNTENLSLGLHLDQDSKGTMVYNYNPSQLITTLNTDNLVIVVTKDAILVANKDSSEELKLLTKRLNEDPKLKKYL